MPIPSKVQAFSINLYEQTKPGSAFGLEIIGAGAFDPADADWACDEVWQPEARGIDIPVGYSGQDWQSCLDRMKGLVIDLLGSDEPWVATIKEKHGLGLGFVDGALEIVWQRQ